MIPNEGCHPKVNIVYIGGKIIQILNVHGRLRIAELFELCESAVQVSLDHVIIALDWLFLKGIIKIDKGIIGIA